MTDNGQTDDNLRTNINACPARLQVSTEVVNLISSDEEEPVRKRPRFSSLVTDEDDDDLEVVSCIRARVSKSNQTRSEQRSFETTNRGDEQPTASTTTRTMSVRSHGSDAKNTASEQVEVVESRRGVQALVDYAHFRFQCATKPFKRQRLQRKQLYCQKCFCYVCDVPVEKCGQWIEHCKATDTLAQWRNLRKTRLDDRRKLAVDPGTRGTQMARATTPTVVDSLISDSESIDEAMSTDTIEGAQWYPQVGRAALEEVNLQLESVLLENNCFSMRDIGRLIEEEREPSSLGPGRGPLCELLNETSQWT